MKTTIITLLQLAGLTHLGLIGAGALMPRVVQLRTHLADRPPFVRQLFWTYYAFIGLCLISFGAISFFLAEPLASGTILARTFCLFLTAFWTLRLIAAICILDVTAYLKTPLHRTGYWATNLVFAALPIIYLIAALKSS
jgi:hypothetical protein